MSTKPDTRRLIDAAIDDAEAGHLLTCGWLRTEGDRWMPPCSENLASFTRAEAIAAQRVIDSGAVVARDQLNRF